ncbi:MAG: hypothetical protein AAFR76_01495 [Planctomycetota bacterium]
MSYFNTNYTQRLEFGIYNSAGAVSGTGEATLNIPKTLQSFWGHVKPDGYDVVFTTADGITVIPHERVSDWNHADRVGNFKLNGLTLEGEATQRFFLYTGYPGLGDTPGDDPSTGLSQGGSPLSGDIFGAIPRGEIIQVRVGLEEQEAEQSRNAFQKESSEVLRIWWDFTQFLHVHPEKYNGRNTFEEIAAVVGVDVSLVGAGSDGSMFAAEETRFGNGLVSTIIRAGTSTNNYTAVCRIKTTFNQEIEGRTRFRVQDVT